MLSREKSDISAEKSDFFSETIRVFKEISTNILSFVLRLSVSTALSRNKKRFINRSHVQSHLIFRTASPKNPSFLILPTQSGIQGSAITAGLTLHRANKSAHFATSSRHIRSHTTIDTQKKDHYVTFSSPLRLCILSFFYICRHPCNVSSAKDIKFARSDLDNTIIKHSNS